MVEKLHANRGPGRGETRFGDRRASFMKRFLQFGSTVAFWAAVFSLQASAQKSPAIFSNYLKLNEMVKGEVCVVVPPTDINKFVARVEAAAKADPAWFKEFSKNSKPGVPLPYHEKLGISKEEYDEYIKLWDQREMTPVPDGNVVIRLEQPAEGQWMIRVTGKGSPISLLRYHEKGDSLKSPNGLMTRLPDINADARSILGKWTGQEWKFEEQDGLGTTKENFAIGKLVDTKYGLLVYRLQSLSPGGRLLYDKSLVIRFPLAAK